MTTIEDQLRHDIKTTDKPNITFVAGHFPMTYDFAAKTAKYDLQKWGSVPQQTMEVGCELAQYAKSIGKNAKFAVICDDRRYLDEMLEVNGLNKVPTWATRRRRETLQSGLPEELQNILEKYNFGKDSLVRDHDNVGKPKYDAISEVGLIWRGPHATSVCARAYNSFVGDPQLCNLKTDYIVGMVPEMCANNVCEGVLDMRRDLSSSHVFLPTDETMIRAIKTRADLFSGMLGNVRYRKTGK